MSAVQIVIIDDHPIFRAGLVQVVRESDAYEVVGEAEDGGNGVRIIEERRPHIAVVDIGLPVMDGLSVARIVRQKKLPTKIVVLTMYKEQHIFNEAMDIGVNGYMLKESGVIELTACLNAVQAGEVYISPAISGLLMKRRTAASELRNNKPSLGNLTKTEAQVLKMIALNKTSKEIATQLFISPHTVETHRKNICQKLDLHGSQALLRFALEHRGGL